MNVLKRVKDFLGSQDGPEDFGIVSAAPRSQQETMLRCSSVLKNPGSLALANVRLKNYLCRRDCNGRKEGIKPPLRQFKPTILTRGRFLSPCMSAHRRGSLVGRACWMMHPV